MRSAAALLLLAIGFGAYAQPPDARPPPVLVVGQPVVYTPAARPVSVICDDLAVVRVEDTGASLRLTGLKPGETTCSFGSPLHPGRRELYRIVVRASP